MLNDKRIMQIRAIMSLRDTEDLLNIWQTNDRTEWSPETFVVIERILKERLGEIPSQEFAGAADAPDTRLVPGIESGLRDDPTPLVDKRPLALAHAESHLKDAMNYLENSDYELAMEEVQCALHVIPTSAAAHNIMGLIYDELGQTEMAAAAYREAIRLDPYWSDPRQNLSELEAESQDKGYYNS